MASALNKRQQARNERTLQELIKTVPGNGTCADCGAKNPGKESARAARLELTAGRMGELERMFPFATRT
jgi:hypothetical protein